MKCVSEKNLVMKFFLNLIGGCGGGTCGHNVKLDFKYHSLISSYRVPMERLNFTFATFSKFQGKVCFFVDCLMFNIV